MDFKIRRAVRPDFTLPSGALYFRHYEVGAPSRHGWMDMYGGGQRVARGSATVEADAQLHLRADR